MSTFFERSTGTDFSGTRIVIFIREFLISIPANQTKKSVLFDFFAVKKHRSRELNFYNRGTAASNDRV